MARLHLLRFSACLLFIVCLTSAQEIPERLLWFHPDQEVRVENLPSLTAISTSSTAILTAALEIVIHDKAVCCGKNSALEDDVQADPQSLKELSAKLHGRHVMTDGRPIMVNAQFISPASVSPGVIVGTLMDNHALLMQWKSNLYVLYGAVFAETRFESGDRFYAIQKLLLLDPRFEDHRREAVFNRESDDFRLVQGLMTLEVKQP